MREQQNLSRSCKPSIKYHLLKEQLDVFVSLSARELDQHLTDACSNAAVPAESVSHRFTLSILCCAADLISSGYNFHICTSIYTEQLLMTNTF